MQAHRLLQSGKLIFDGGLDEVMARYARHKLLHVQLQVDAETPESLPDLGADAEVIECTRQDVRVRVPRETVPDASAKLLQALPVRDLAIQEEDVGTVIQRIFDRQVDPS